MIIMLLILTCLPQIVADTNDAENDGSYYFGYGDSIMAGNSCCYNDKGEGTGSSGLYNFFNGSFVTRMRELYDPTSSSDHVNQPCGGNQIALPGDGDRAWDYGSVWYIYDWMNWSNTYFIVMIGINDYRDNQPISETITGLMRVYNETMENGTTPVICIPMGMGDTGGWKSYFETLTEAFRDYSVRTVPMWDAVDLSPFDGVMDNIDTTLYAQDTPYRLHITTDGHNVSAWWLWYWIQGWDYNTTYWATNNTMLVDADYNQTVFINCSYWNPSHINVTYASNGTAVTNTTQNDYYGNPHIRFDVKKGEQYLIEDGTNNLGDFTDICGLANQSDIGDYGGVVWGNISYPTALDLTTITEDSQIISVEFYKVRIANDTFFGYPLAVPFYEEDNLPQFFTLNGGGVAVPYYGTHYYNAGVRVKVRSK